MRGFIQFSVAVELVIVTGIDPAAVDAADALAHGGPAFRLDDFLINYGFSSSIGGMKKWGFEVQGNAVVVNSKMETTIPGVYAIGDIGTYSGKVKLIATGFGEAPIAVNNAMAYINPDTRVQPMHSTSLF